MVTEDMVNAIDHEGRVVHTHLAFGIFPMLRRLSLSLMFFLPVSHQSSTQRPTQLQVFSLSMLKSL